MQFIAAFTRLVAVPAAVVRLARIVLLLQVRQQVHTLRLAHKNSLLRLLVLRSNLIRQRATINIR